MRHSTESKEAYLEFLESLNMATEEGRKRQREECEEICISLAKDYEPKTEWDRSPALGYYLTHINELPTTDTD